MSICEKHQLKKIKKSLGKFGETEVCPICEAHENSKTEKEISDPHVIEIYKSLVNSVNSAGGAGENFTKNRLQNMSAYELLRQLGPNGIEFIYNKVKHETVGE